MSPRRCTDGGRPRAYDMNTRDGTASFAGCAWRTAATRQWCDIRAA
jgi:hypothetical protein